MAKGIKICRVCGKEYESCRTLRPNLNNEFRWQEVACSPEHGAEYLRRVMAARGQTDVQKAEEPAPKAAAAKAAETVEQAANEIKPVKRTRRKKQTGSDRAKV